MYNIIRYMKNKLKSILISILWCLIIVLFPVLSGVVCAVCKIESPKTFYVQAASMALSLIIPSIFLLIKKWKISDIGFSKFDHINIKKALYFIPVLLIFVPVSIKGFNYQGSEYFFGVLLLYLFVGIAEEVYFRGIIPYYLNKEFDTKWIIIISSLIFGLGHMSVAFTGTNALDIILTVINAFIFGFMAIEMKVIGKNITPIIIVHFLFDFETKIINLNKDGLMIAEIVRGTLMVLISIWLLLVIYQNKIAFNNENIIGEQNETE